jgi:hypothetical protein
MDDNAPFEKLIHKGHHGRSAPQETGCVVKPATGCHRDQPEAAARAANDSVERAVVEGAGESGERTPEAFSETGSEHFPVANMGGIENNALSTGKRLFDVLRVLPGHQVTSARERAHGEPRGFQERASE